MLFCLSHCVPLHAQDMKPRDALQVGMLEGPLWEVFARSMLSSLQDVSDLLEVSHTSILQSAKVFMTECLLKVS